MLSREIACTIFKSSVFLDRVSNHDMPRTMRAFYHWTTYMVNFSVSAVKSTLRFQERGIEIMQTLHQYKYQSYIITILITAFPVYSLRIVDVNFPRPSSFFSAATEGDLHRSSVPGSVRLSHYSKHYRRDERTAHCHQQRCVRDLQDFCCHANSQCYRYAYLGGKEKQNFRTGVILCRTCDTVV